MSRASEWAKARPKSCEHADSTVAQVEAYGGCVISGYSMAGEPTTILLSDNRALALAHWILATFGESK